ncbi:MAG: zinc-ribbon domain-containing protein [Myxococcota bacterium]
MDVRCERCKTEYEFDDARITEAGVTVKCTTCGHVFKVKKKALVVTVPVRPGEGEPSPEIGGAGVGGAREWKVRQASGNVFNFKELTTLQKWIVERKVSRDDEISLTGESWKRLGNIAELASFFQVVDEAQKAQQLQGMLLLTPPAGTRVNPPAQEPSAVISPPTAPTLTQVPPPPPPAPAPRSGSTPVGRLSSPEPAFTRAPKAPPPLDDDELEAAAFQRKKGGAGKGLLFLLILVALGAGGYYGYFHYWLPRQEEAQRQEAESQRLVEEQRLAQEKAEAEAKAKAEAEAQEAQRKKEEEERLAREAAADAGASEVKPAKAEPVRDFDFYMAQGDRLREREKAAAALDAYGNAADLSPDRAEPIAGRGLALLDMGQTLQAEAAFQRALELNGRYGVAIMGLAETYRSMGKNAEAVKYYERYLEVLPSGPEAAVARNAIERLK